MARADPQMKIRLPEALKEKIEAAAKESGRTLNAEVVGRLESSFGFNMNDVAKKEALLKLVNDAIDERIEQEFARKKLEKPDMAEEFAARAEGIKAIQPAQLGAQKPRSKP
jgi:predicted DNA-binding protein